MSELRVESGEWRVGRAPTRNSPLVTRNGSEATLHCPPLLALASPKRAEHADFWWRIARPFARLADAGVTAEVCWLGDDELPTISPAGRVVIVQRTGLVMHDQLTGMISTSAEQAEAWIGRIRAAGALAVVAEMDDDTLTDAYLDWLLAAGGLTLVARDRLLVARDAWRHVVALADAVTVSTPYLAEVVRGWTDRPVSVVPNGIDVSWFRGALRATTRQNDGPVIGWAGGRRPETDLAPMAAAWRRIAARHPSVTFVVAGWQSDVIYRELDAADALDRLTRIPWADLETYPSSYQVDIGCCPLADTAFNRSKSPIKLWEYVLAGASAVASPTVYHGCCLDREEWLAADVDAWERALDYHVRRHRYGVRGPDPWLVGHVAREHGLEPQIVGRAAVYREIAAGSRVAV